MESKTAEQQVIWSQKHSDFSIVLKSGKVLEAHKFILAKNSAVFRAMLEQEMMESKTNQVKIEDFGEATVISFLEYIYSDVVREEKTIAILSQFIL